jgi:hypothetical protein
MKSALRMRMVAFWSVRSSQLLIARVVHANPYRALSVLRMSVDQIAFGHRKSVTQRKIRVVRLMAKAKMHVK